MSKTINIYLNSQERKLVDDLKVKYRLSLTTIVDVITKHTFKYFLQYAYEYNNKNEEDLKRLYKEYIYNKGKKTSIKEPQIFKKENGGDYLVGNEYAKGQSKSKFTTNCLIIYLNKDIKNYVKEEEMQKAYWNNINKELTTRKDDWWNYNDHIRYQRRMLRENKEYFKKALEN